jgi:hypothetical protein
MGPRDEVGPPGAVVITSPLPLRDHDSRRRQVSACRIRTRPVSITAGPVHRGQCVDLVQPYASAYTAGYPPPGRAGDTHVASHWGEPARRPALTRSAAKSRTRLT